MKERKIILRRGYRGSFLVWALRTAIVGFTLIILLPGCNKQPPKPAAKAPGSGAGVAAQNLPKSVVDLGGGVKMEMIQIPAGEFMMGGEESAEETAAFFNNACGENFCTAESFKNEHPQHRVRITRPFFLGKYPVTRGQFRRFAEEAGYKTDSEMGKAAGTPGWNAGIKKFSFSGQYSWHNTGFEQTDEHPVVDVSWNDAIAFCRWLSHKEGKPYRLPTEAQWEYACRAGTTTRYYFGDDPEMLAKYGNVADAAAKAKFAEWKYTIKASDGYAFTSPVGRFRPNAFGLYDMLGNASQWCMDWYGATYYAESPTDDPKGPESGVQCVQRGGSWSLRPFSARCAARGLLAPVIRDIDTGFRVARTQ